MYIVQYMALLELHIFKVSETIPTTTEQTPAKCFFYIYNFSVKKITTNIMHMLKFIQKVSYKIYSILECKTVLGQGNRKKKSYFLNGSANKNGEEGGGGWKPLPLRKK